jgi:hypothetical protein
LKKDRKHNSHKKKDKQYNGEKSETINRRTSHTMRKNCIDWINVCYIHFMLSGERNDNMRSEEDIFKCTM